MNIDWLCFILEVSRVFDPCLVSLCLCVTERDLSAQNKNKVVTFCPRRVSGDI